MAWLTKAPLSSAPAASSANRLDRWWSDEPRALVCGFNPSRAGAKKNDPTIHRLFDLLHGRPGIGGFTMVNSDSYSATDLADRARWTGALSLDAPNTIRVVDRALIRALSQDPAVRIVAWGAFVAPRLNANRILAALSHDAASRCTLSRSAEPAGSPRARTLTSLTSASARRLPTRSRRAAIIATRDRSRARSRNSAFSAAERTKGNEGGSQRLQRITDASPKD